MRREKWDTLPDEVERVRVRFALWRQTRRGRSRIPEELWSAATELALSHGVHPIARALSLNDQALRRRLQETRPQAIAQPQPESSPQSTHTNAPEQDHATVRPRPLPPPPAPTLIELPWPAPPARPSTHCRIELRQPGGSQMTITLEGAGGAATPCGLDLPALVRAFGGDPP